MDADYREGDVPASPPEQIESPEPASKGLGKTGQSAIRGDDSVSESRYEWKDQGMQNVPVKDLPNPEGVTRSEDFDHHISYEDAIQATKQYQEMQPEIARGTTGEDFSARDQANGLDYEHGQRRVYDLFHGSDPIRLDKNGDHYDIVSGRHRIFAAKEVGLEKVPAHVIEKLPR